MRQRLQQNSRRMLRLGNGQTRPPRSEGSSLHQHRRQRWAAWASRDPCLGSDENGCWGSEVRFQRSSEEVAGAVSNQMATDNPLQVRPTPLSIAPDIIIGGVTTCVCGRPLQPPMIALALAGRERHQVSERKRHPRQRLRPPRLEHHCKIYMGRFQKRGKKTGGHSQNATTVARGAARREAGAN